MKKIKTAITTVCVGTLIVCGCIGCGSTEEQTTDSAGADSNSGTYYDGKVILSCSTWTGYAPLFIAEEKGYFEEHGVDLDIQLIESAGDLKAAAASGQIQAYANTIDTAILSAEGGLDLKQVLALDTSKGGDGVVAKKEYSSLDDLKGKKIALNTTGGASLFYFNYLIEEEGLTMDDFDIQNMSSGDAGSAFVGGKVDAAVTWEPWLTNAKDTDFGKVLYSSEDVPGVIVDSLCFNTDFVEQYPDTVQGVVDGWFDALEFIETDQDEAYEIMAESQGLTKEEFEENAKTVTYYDQEANKEYFESGEMERICQMASDTWVRLGFMENPVEPKDVYDSSFVVD